MNEWLIDCVFSEVSISVTTPLAYCQIVTLFCMLYFRKYMIEKLPNSNLLLVLTDRNLADCEECDLPLVPQRPQEDILYTHTCGKDRKGWVGRG